MKLSGGLLKSFVGLALVVLLFSPSLAMAEPSSVDSLAKEIQTPAAVAQYMQSHFSYVSDEVQFGVAEYWQSADEILHRGQGDCEDYAIFAKAILEQNGYRVLLVSVYWDDNAHTVAIFKKNGVIGMINLENLQVTNDESLASFANQVRDNWTYVGLMRQDGNSGLISQKFSRNIAFSVQLSGLFA